MLFDCPFLIIYCGLVVIRLFYLMTETQSRLARPLFLTSRKSQPITLEDCQYCMIKQKFSGPDQKCLEHTITDKKSQEDEENSQHQDTIIDHVLELLMDAQDSLEDYWNNLYDYRHGNSQRVEEELQPVHQAVRRIQQKLSKFPCQESESILHVQTKRNHYDPMQQQKKMATRSQKFITSNFSELFDDISINDQIKEWVLYFHKIMVNKQLHEELLPLDEEIDMRIFKESMERKFLAFAKNYDRYERRLGQALERLLFYMQQFGSDLNGEMLTKDLLFIQQNQQAIPQQQSHNADYHRCVLMQALSIEHLLADKELSLQSSRFSRSQSMRQ